ncbi:MAG: hypothetical protein ACTSR8_00885 [Promethearchaeota archaeon]
MNKKILVFICLMGISSILFFNTATPARAQNYSFEVDSEIVNVYIEKDGSITIEYWINFTCDLGAHSIDYVDIGFPNQHYDIDSVKADLDGQKVSITGPSPYVEYGVEIYLGSNAIMPGESGTLHVKGNNPKMVYEDYEDISLASVEFSPTWFDSDFCPKFDFLQVNFYFPDGCDDGDEVKYHYEKYDAWSRDDDGDLIFTWEKENAEMKQYTFGVSFPKKYVDSYQPWTSNPLLVMGIVTILLTITLSALIAGGIFLLYRYIKNYKTHYYPPKKKTRPGDIAGIMCCMAFFGGFILLIFWGIMGDIVLILLFFIIVIAGFAMIGYLIYRVIDNMKLPYFKPNIKIDCVGVNKKLTVVEAAIIQNTPLNKVIFLIIFPLIRSGHLKVASADPFKLEVVSEKGISKMRAYQKKFIKGIKKGTLTESYLKKLLVDLIKATYRKMRGYKLDATIRYYQNMIKEAWEAVKKMPEEIEWEEIEKYYDYLVLDDHFEKRSEKYLYNRYYCHRPYYYNRYYYYDYYYPKRHYGSYHGGASAPPKERINIYSFSDSIVRGIENVSNNIVSAFSKFADKIVSATAPPKPKTSGGYRSGGGGGGGCACACACAGCACACAGGGR